MKPNLESSFISFNLTPAQVVAGSTFTSDQRAVIQNMISDIAEEKITLTFDPTNPNVFIQRDAELMGQLGILKYLLSLESTMQLNNQPEES